MRSACLCCRGPGGSLGPVTLGKLGEHQLRDASQRFLDADAGGGHGLEDRRVQLVDLLVEHLDREDVGQIALVELYDDRNIFKLQPVVTQVRPEVLIALDVGFQELFLESTTKTIPSTPFSTSFRVEL